MVFTEVMTEITEQERDQYLNGECSVLAIAISELTGWQIVLNTSDDGGTGHALVRRSDGTLIDITCEPTTAAELIAAWPESTIITADRYDLSEWGWEVPRRDEDGEIVPEIIDVARRVIEATS